MTTFEEHLRRQERARAEFADMQFYQHGREFVSGPPIEVDWIHRVRKRIETIAQDLDETLKAGGTHSDCCRDAGAKAS